MVSCPQYLFYFYCGIFMLLFVHFTTVIQTQQDGRPVLDCGKFSNVISLKIYRVFGEDYFQRHALWSYSIHYCKTCFTNIWKYSIMGLKCFWNNLIRNRNFYLFFKYLFFCTWSCLWHVRSSTLTRNWTGAPCVGRRNTFFPDFYLAVSSEYGN